MSDSKIESFQFDWVFRYLVIKVEVTLNPRCFGSNHDHLELRVIAPMNHPLPITPTGYQSMWPIHQEYASAELAAKAIQVRLEEASSRPEWLDYVAELEQPSLF